MAGIAVIMIDVDQLPDLGKEKAHELARVLGATASFTAFGNKDLSGWTIVKNQFGQHASGLPTTEMLQEVANHVVATRSSLEEAQNYSASELIVGTGVFVVKRGTTGKLKFLLGKRTATCRRGAGCWALPGGICEIHETIIDCAEREVFEETGLRVKVVSPHKFNASLPPCLEHTVPCLAVTDHRPREPHISFWMLAEYKGGEVWVREPDKCSSWHWVDLPFVEALGPDVLSGEQQYWTPLNLWRQILPPLGFTTF